MKKLVLISILFLTACAGRAENTLEREFRKSCADHKGLKSMEDKGHGVYNAQCYDGSLLRGIIRQGS